MEFEKIQKNVGKMLERFRKGKEDMSVVYTKDSSFSRGGKDKQIYYSRGRVIIFRNEKKILDGSYDSKSSDLPKSFQCCMREGDDARCQMIFSCKEAGLDWYSVDLSLVRKTKIAILSFFTVSMRALVVTFGWAKTMSLE